MPSTIAQAAHYLQVAGAIHADLTESKVDEVLPIRCVWNLTLRITSLLSSHLLSTPAAKSSRLRISSSMF